MTATERPELVDREKFVGASEVAAVLGLLPWRTPVDVYLSKVDPGSVAPAGPAAERGTLLEDPVARLWARRHEVKIRRRRKGYVHANGALRAHLDRLVTGTNDALEVKTTTDWNRKHLGEDGTDEIPLWYRVQGLAQMACVPRLERVRFAVLVAPEEALQAIAAATRVSSRAVEVMLKGLDLRSYTIERDPEPEAAVAAAALAFLAEHVRQRIPPDPVTPDDARKLWSPIQGTSVPADEITIDQIETLRDLRAERARCKEAEDRILAQIMATMGAADHLVDPGGNVLATWKERKASRRVDSKRLRSEFPDVYDKVSNVGEASRTFLLKQRKGKTE